jgi:hypothetical protein
MIAMDENTELSLRAQMYKELAQYVAPKRAKMGIHCKWSLKVSSKRYKIRPPSLQASVIIRLLQQRPDPLSARSVTPSCSTHHTLPDLGYIVRSSGYAVKLILESLSAHALTRHPLGSQLVGP